MAEKMRSEELIEKKWDQCATNLIKKTSIAFASGVVLSVLLFKSTPSSSSSSPSSSPPLPPPLLLFLLLLFSLSLDPVLLGVGAEKDSLMLHGCLDLNLSLSSCPLLSSPCCCTGRAWPVTFSTGVGIGIAYAECQLEFANQEIIGRKRISSSSAIPSSSVTPTPVPTEPVASASS